MISQESIHYPNYQCVNPSLSYVNTYEKAVIKMPKKFQRKRKDTQSNRGLEALWPDDSYLFNPALYSQGLFLTVVII